MKPQTNPVCSLLRAVVMISPLLLAACQSPGPKPGDSGNTANPQLVAEREAKLHKLDEFQFSGGLGIWTDEESLTARVLWHQSAESLQLDLSAPLGIGDVRLQETPDRVTLTRGSKTIARGNTADEVLQRGLNLAAPVPVQQLAQWVRGLPGQAESVSRDSAGKIVSLYFNDALGTRWQARFKQYQRFNELTVPALITASGGPYSVRLKLKDWQTITKKEQNAPGSTKNRLPIPSR